MTTMADDRVNQLLQAARLLQEANREAHLERERDIRVILSARTEAAADATAEIPQTPWLG